MAMTKNDYLIQQPDSINERLKQKIIFGREPELEFSLTPKCLQHMWSAAYCFPCCPKETGIQPINDYFKYLKNGAIFAYNEDSPKLIVTNCILTDNRSTILVMCEREGTMCEREGFKPWSIIEISYWNGFFIHSNLGSYFEKDDADEAFQFTQHK